MKPRGRYTKCEKFCKYMSLSSTGWCCRHLNIWYLKADSLPSRAICEDVSIPSLPFCPLCTRWAPDPVISGVMGPYKGKFHTHLPMYFRPFIEVITPLHITIGSGPAIGWAGEGGNPIEDDTMVAGHSS